MSTAMPYTGSQTKPISLWDYSELSKRAEQFAKQTTHEENKLETNQVRKFLSAVTKLRYQLKGDIKNLNEIKQQLVVLKARFKYQIAKLDDISKKRAVQDFEKDLSNKLDELINSNPVDKEKVKMFIDYIEMFTAYHKYEEIMGGSSNGRAK